MGRPGSVLLILLLAVLAPHSAMALVSFDFETPYLVHETRQVWDFCIVPHQGEYHAFYHTVPQQDLHAAPPRDASKVTVAMVPRPRWLES